MAVQCSVTLSFSTAPSSAFVLNLAVKQGNQIVEQRKFIRMKQQEMNLIKKPLGEDEFHQSAKIEGVCHSR